MIACCCSSSTLLILASLLLLFQLGNGQTIQIADDFDWRCTNLACGNDNNDPDVLTTTMAQWKNLVPVPGASFVSVDFEVFDLPDDCSVELCSNDDTHTCHVYTHRGRFDKGHFRATHLNGDSISLTLTCTFGLPMNTLVFESSGGSAGLPSSVLDHPPNVDEPQEGEERRRHLSSSFLRGHEYNEEPRSLSICENSDIVNVECARTQEPDIYDLTHAVVRVRENTACTGFLVAPNLILTNWHCRNENTDSFENHEFEFLVQQEDCHDTQGGRSWGAGARETPYDYFFQRLVAYSSSFDYALIQVAPERVTPDIPLFPGERFGYLTLDNRRPGTNERIFIPQHTYGWSKRIAMTSDAPNDNGGRCRVLNNGSRRTCGGSYTQTWYHGGDVLYACDTAGGTSGSPVISYTSKTVVALHHCGGACNGNKGVPIPPIYSTVQPLIDDNIAFYESLQDDNDNNNNDTGSDTGTTGDNTGDGGDNNDESCQDSTTWRKDGKENETCQRFAEKTKPDKLEEDCHKKKDQDGTTAYEACRQTCGNCPGVSINPLVDDNSDTGSDTGTGTGGDTGTGTGTGTGECVDDPTWLEKETKEGKEPKDCVWVAEKPEKNCDKESKIDDTMAYDACQATCLGYGSPCTP